MGQRECRKQLSLASGEQQGVEKSAVNHVLRKYLRLCKNNSSRLPSRSAFKIQIRALARGRRVNEDRQHKTTELRTEQRHEHRSLNSHVSHICDCMRRTERAGARTW